MASQGQTLAVFVSSAISDMEAAEDALQGQVFSRLCRLCQCSETDFVAVREEAGEEAESTAAVGGAQAAGWSREFLTRAPAGRQGRTAPSWHARLPRRRR